MTRQEKKFSLVLFPLLFITLIGITILTVTHTMTRKGISENERTARLRILDSVMPLSYNNRLYDDVIQIENTGISDSMHPLEIFRARYNNKPTGVILMPVRARGYSGKIELIIGIDFDGTVLGVRTLNHKESKGLGDQIDQTKSDWIMQFTNLSLGNPAISDWAVTDDGGKIDQISGATITSRGVVNAVRKSLEFYQANRDKLYQ